MTSVAALAALLTAAPQIPPELDAYIKKPEPKFAAKIVFHNPNRLDVALTSQTWQGFDWKHRLIVLQPKKLANKGIAILTITGGKSNPKDLKWAQDVADRSGMPVASLFDIPNQPLFDLKEDDLIAYSFKNYLETGKSDWPLLFPMTKSAIKAMDALQSLTKASKNPLKRFVITGESKRGWTSWLTAATGDMRIAGIAPMIYDNLNIPEQLKHQMKIWGHYSPMYAAYKEQGLLDVLQTPPGKKLAAMVDPYSYWPRIQKPLLSVIGGNDPFWAIDASSVYWNRLTSPKSMLMMPNVGHGFDMKAMTETLSAFAASCAGRFKFPILSWFSGPQGSVFVKTPSRKPLVMHLLRAESPTMDFTQSKWKRVNKLSTANREVMAMLEPNAIVSPNKNCTAWSVEARYQISGFSFSLSTPPIIAPAR